MEEAERNQTCHLAKRIESSQAQTSQHFEELLNNAQDKTDRNLADIRNEAASNNQTLHVSITQLKDQVQSNQAVMEDLKLEVRSEVAKQNKVVDDKIEAAHAPLKARLDAKEAAGTNSAANFVELKESVAPALALGNQVKPLVSCVAKHSDQLQQQEQRADRLESELKLLKAKQTKSDAVVSALSSAPHVSAIP